MTPSALLALADRCEAANGADLALSAEIAEAIGWTVERNIGEQPTGFATPPGRHPDDEADQYGGKFMLPHFTASLDAAISLIQEPSCLDHLGAFMCLSKDRKPLWQAIIWQPLKSPWDRNGRNEKNRIGNRGYCATPALALCAAALRARAAAGGGA